MNTDISLKVKSGVVLSNEIMTFAIKFGTVSSALIGIWAVVCLIMALVQAGPVTMITGYAAAVAGY